MIKVKIFLGSPLQLVITTHHHHNNHRHHQLLSLLALLNLLDLTGLIHHFAVNHRLGHDLHDFPGADVGLLCRVRGGRRYEKRVRDRGRKREMKRYRDKGREGRREFTVGHHISLVGLVLNGQVLTFGWRRNFLYTAEKQKNGLEELTLVRCACVFLGHNFGDFSAT